MMISVSSLGCIPCGHMDFGMSGQLSAPYPISTESSKICIPTDSARRLSEAGGVKLVSVPFRHISGQSHGRKLEESTEI